LHKIDFWDVLEGRGSVRRFQPRPVEHELIETMLTTGMRAPNAHNNQSWRFAVLTEKSRMIRLAEAMQPDYLQALINSGVEPEKAAEMAATRKARLTGAPVAVVVCFAMDDLTVYEDETRSRGEVLMAIQSAAMAGGHILLAAHALGLGGVWMCAPMFVPEIVREELDLQADWQPQGMLLIGYPEEEPVYRQRKPLEEIVQWVS
jgi:coenzyme F420-0:L-glutamate ligase/coenzyme F420-1:gamma-L-glutamate ligase